MDGREHPIEDREQLELSKKIFELSSVIDLSKAFISTLDPELIHTKVVFTIMGVVGAKRGALFFYDPEKRRLTLHKAVNFPTACAPASLDLTKEQANALERIVKPVFLSALDPAEHSFLQGLRAGGLIPDPLLIPLAADKKVLGFILLAEKLNATYSEDDIAMVSSMANYSAMALYNKRMVDMLIKSEKMADLGRLGSGIVHEIKNPLTSIIMISDVLLDKKKLDPKTTKFVSVIGREAQRILHLCQNILLLARPKQPEMKAVDLNKVVRETLSLVSYELKKGKVELGLDLQEGGVVPLGDEEKLKQVLLNLVINAVHAMEGGGTLTIATRTSPSSAAEIPEGYSHRVLGGTPAGGATALLRIRDEGSGMNPAVLDKIFEPFFTTKAEGTGTGLGLYVTRNIVMEHRGRLTVMTRPGVGTIFHIELPLAADTSAAVKKAAKPRQTRKGTAAKSGGCRTGKRTTRHRA